MQQLQTEGVSTKVKKLVTYLMSSKFFNNVKQAFAVKPKNMPNDGFLNSNISIGGRNLTVSKFLAQGGFAFVYVATETNNPSHRYALKRMIIQTRQALDDAINELYYHAMFHHHPNVVRLHGCKVAGRDVELDPEAIKQCLSMHVAGQSCEILFLMDLCVGGSLVDIMLQNQSVHFPEQFVWTAFASVVSVVCAIHAQGVINRDLKIENLLFLRDTEGASPTMFVPHHAKYIKLCDFGSCTSDQYTDGSQFVKNPTLRNKLEQEILKKTTPSYRAPEMIDLFQRMPITCRSDVFAMGVILFRLMYYTLPFPDGELLANLNVRYRFPDEDQYGSAGANHVRYSDDLKKVVRACFVKNPDNRADIWDIAEIVCKRCNVDYVPRPDGYYAHLQPSSAEAAPASVPAAAQPATGGATGNIFSMLTPIPGGAAAPPPSFSSSANVNASKPAHQAGEQPAMQHQVARPPAQVAAPAPPPTDTGLPSDPAAQLALFTKMMQDNALKLQQLTQSIPSAPSSVPAPAAPEVAPPVAAPVAAPVAVPVAAPVAAPPVQQTTVADLLDFGGVPTATDTAIDNDFNTLMNVLQTANKPKSSVASSSPAGPSAEIADVEYAETTPAPVVASHATPMLSPYQEELVVSVPAAAPVANVSNPSTEPVVAPLSNKPQQLDFWDDDVWAGNHPPENKVPSTASSVVQEPAAVAKDPVPPAAPSLPAPAMPAMPLPIQPLAFDPQAFSHMPLEQQQMMMQQMMMQQQLMQMQLIQMQNLSSANSLHPTPPAPAPNAASVSAPAPPQSQSPQAPKPTAQGANGDFFDLLI